MQLNFTILAVVAVTSLVMKTGAAITPDQGSATAATPTGGAPVIQRQVQLGHQPQLAGNFRINADHEIRNWRGTAQSQTEGDAGEDQVGDEVEDRDEVELPKASQTKPDISPNRQNDMDVRMEALLRPSRLNRIIAEIGDVQKAEKEFARMLRRHIENEQRLLSQPLENEKSENILGELTRIMNRRLRNRNLGWFVQHGRNRASGQLKEEGKAPLESFRSSEGY